MRSLGMWGKLHLEITRKHARNSKNTEKQTQNTTHIATNGGLSAGPIKKPMRIASKTQENKTKHTYSS